MFDIDYILGNKKRTKPVKSSGFNLFNMSPSKKSPSKSTFNVDANVILNGQPSKTQRPLGYFLGDRVTKKQRAFLNKTRLGYGKSHLRFFDHDGDGVISGLDCAPRNEKRHSAKPNKLMRDRLNSIDIVNAVPGGVISKKHKRAIEGTFKRFPELQRELHDEDIDLVHDPYNDDDDVQASAYHKQNNQKAFIHLKKPFYDGAKDERASALKHEIQHIKQGEVDKNYKNWGDVKDIKKYFEQPDEREAEMAAIRWKLNRNAPYLDDETKNRLVEERFKMTKGEEVDEEYLEQARLRSEKQKQEHFEKQIKGLESEESQDV